MKQTLLSILCFLSAFFSYAQSNISFPQLSYTVSIPSDSALAHDLSAALQREKMTIQVVSDTLATADVCVLTPSFHGSLPTHNEAYIVQVLYPNNARKAAQNILKVHNTTDAVRQLTRFLRQRYYTGQRPTYSLVFTPGEKGYKTFRIPSVITLPNGRIIAAIEARAEGKTDCAENDILIKYSDDEGRTWSSIVEAATAGKSSLNNPVMVYVEELHRILLLYQQYPPKTYESNTQAGLEGDNITRFFVIHSDDNGETWSTPLDITRQAKVPLAKGYASGPGIAIRVVAGPDKGRIIVPMNVSAGEKGWFNYLVASDDLGLSWFILSGMSSYGTNESQVVQISPDKFMINARCHRFEGNEHRTPEGWNPWNFSKVTRMRGDICVDINGQEVQWHATRLRPDLPDPLCQGSIYRYSGLTGKERSILLFSNAANTLSLCSPDKVRRTPPARINGVVRVSYDNGETWGNAKRIYGNRYTPFQYSVLTRMKHKKIGCLFETGDNVVFTSFGLDWLTAGH